MLRSLRFQLPALFLLGVVVAGLVSAAIALRLFRSYAQNRARAQADSEVAREAVGLTKVYSQRAGDERSFPRRRRSSRPATESSTPASRSSGEKVGFGDIPRKILLDPAGVSEAAAPVRVHSARQ